MVNLNLLPPEEKDSISIEKTNRRIVLFGIDLAAILLIFIILLSSIYILINIKLKKTEADLKNAQAKFSIEGLRDLQIKIRQTNEQIKNLDEIQTGHRYYSQALAKITEIIPAGVLIRTVSINQNQDLPDGSQAIIEGFSSSRESVLAIKQALETSSSFEQIESPISNLLKPNDIDFRFSFVIKKEALEYNGSMLISP